MTGARSRSGTRYRTSPRFVHRVIWLPGLVSQSVVVWDSVGLETVAEQKGHTGLRLLSHTRPSEHPEKQCNRMRAQTRR
jgi:hypothetical protein